MQNKRLSSFQSSKINVHNAIVTLYRHCLPCKYTSFVAHDKTEKYYFFEEKEEEKEYNEDEELGKITSNNRVRTKITTEEDYPLIELVSKQRANGSWNLSNLVRIKKSELN